MTARRGTVARGALRDTRRSLVGWTIAVAAVAALYTVFYPTIGAEKFEVMLDAIPDFAEFMGLDAIISGAGYVGATVYSLLGAILTLVCAIALGGRLIAGEEEDDTLELEVSAPVARGRVYSERLAVLWLTVLSLVVAITAVVLALNYGLDLEIEPANVAAVGLGLLVFGGGLGTVAFALGAATGRRGVALAVAGSIAVIAYVFSYLSPLVGQDWMADVSPFHWYIGREPLLNGFDWPGLGLLAALALVAAVLGWPAFRRRDVGV